MKQNIIALGFFDGVHLGHGALLQCTTQYQGTPQVLTFDQHPSSLLQTTPTPLLSSVEDRRWLISHYYGIDRVIVCPFHEIMGMDWKDFIQNYLINQLKITHIVAGHDFRFGKGGEGTPEKLQALCVELGIGCDIVAPVLQDGVVVSSTHIRTLIAKGEMERATEFLGHPHVISNEVVHGNKIGTKTLGFPTVNLQLPDGVIPPAFGVYASRVYVDDQIFIGATNVGIRPTVESEGALSVETFLLDYEGELYGRHIRVEIHQFIRPEKKFDDFPSLSQQIARDVESTRAYFAR
ncbi:MAG: bifunctional riboflavin kinase/FAD synthetase [Eubacteriales bacterium]